MITLTTGKKDLPEDVLYAVLQYVAQNEMPGAQEGIDTARADVVVHDASDYPRVLGWIRFGHICKSWRRVALASRSLWADSIGIFPAGLQEMMRRAGPSHLLTLYLYMGEKRIRVVESLCRQLLAPEVNEVDIKPRLRAIHIEYLESAHDEVVDNHGYYPIRLIGDLFGSGLPVFSHLEMSSACRLSTDFEVIARKGHNLTVD